MAGKDTERILRHYLKAWDKRKVIVIGYSFGADVAPFMVSRLPEDLRDTVQLVALLGASPKATFEFHVMSDWLGAKSKAKSYPTQPEVEKLKGLKVLCVYGRRRYGLPVHATETGFGQEHTTAGFAPFRQGLRRARHSHPERAAIPGKEVAIERYFLSSSAPHLTISSWGLWFAFRNASYPFRPLQILAEKRRGVSVCHGVDHVLRHVG